MWGPTPTYGMLHSPSPRSRAPITCDKFEQIDYRVHDAKLSTEQSRTDGNLDFYVVKMSCQTGSQSHAILPYTLTYRSKRGSVQRCSMLQWNWHKMPQPVVCVPSYKDCSTDSRMRFTVVGYWNALHTNLKSDWPAIFLSAESNEPTCDEIVHAFTDLRKHTQRVCESVLDTVCMPYAYCICVWDRPTWSPISMSAAALTHCTTSRSSSHISTDVWDEIKDRDPTMKQQACNSIVYNTFAP